MGDEPIPATGRSWRASIHGIISPSCKIMTWEYM
ncbi:hypothetical protein BJF96_g2937 [Verticillium dahliae]|uniref:Uncharacterized protein n=1 Tax=Verticillium dahliae TaxID=27337 RepID=A0AA45ANW0_VERDA|nr:hypothetical protein BJF96_g2937 [Verticillium dahliae]